ncbi:glycosyltransferase 87 family protein [Streptomyces albus]|uniref:glycosyltransferase 87 family protein n=1 Tax=Streptomyces albus TaxID=1888 RepID=UPI003F519EC3
MTVSGAVHPRPARPTALTVLTSLPGALCLLALSVGAFGVLAAVQGLPMADVQVYRAEGRAVLDGTDLYGFTVTEWDLPATYPPLAALLFVPVALVPLSVAKAGFLAANVALLALLVGLSLRAVRGRAAPLPVVLALTACALWLEPVFQTLLFGQINLALACLVLWDMGRPDTARGKGFAVGLAAGIKLTPALFAVHLLLTGRVKAAATAAAGFAASVAVGACVLPGATVDFWTRRMFETARVGKAWIVDNQSLQGLVARLLHDPEPGARWLVPALLAAVAGLWLARRLTPRPGRPGTADGTPAGSLGGTPDDGFRGLLVTALVALLVSPISWSHHWVWCVPLLAQLARSAGLTGPAGEGRPPGRGRLLARVGLGCAAVVFTARSLWLVPHTGDLDLRLSWWQQPLAAPYALLTLVLLGAAAGYVRARRRRAPLTPRVPPARISVDGSAADHRTAPPGDDRGRRQDGRRPECDKARGGRCAKHDAGHSADRDPAPRPRGARTRDVPRDHLEGDGGPGRLRPPQLP